jgi:hypothetical protein
MSSPNYLSEQVIEGGNRNREQSLVPKTQGTITLRVGKKVFKVKEPGAAATPAPAPVTGFTSAVAAKESLRDDKAQNYLQKKKSQVPIVEAEQSAKQPETQQLIKENSLLEKASQFQQNLESFGDSSDADDIANLKRALTEAVAAANAAKAKADAEAAAAAEAKAKADAAAAAAAATAAAATANAAVAGVPTSPVTVKGHGKKQTPNCRYGEKCNNQRCVFTHPAGRSMRTAGTGTHQHGKRQVGGSQPVPPRTSEMSHRRHTEHCVFDEKCSKENCSYHHSTGEVLLEKLRSLKTEDDAYIVERQKDVDDIAAKGLPKPNVFSKHFCMAVTEDNCKAYYEGSKFGKGKPCYRIHVTARNIDAFKKLGIRTTPTDEFNAALGNTQLVAQTALDQKKKEFAVNALSAMSNLATTHAELDAAQAELQATQAELHATQDELEDCSQALDRSEEINNDLTVLQAIYMPNRCEYCDKAGGVPNYNGTGLVFKGCRGFNLEPGFTCANVFRVARFLQPGMY